MTFLMPPNVLMSMENGLTAIITGERNGLLSGEVLCPGRMYQDTYGWKCKFMHFKFFYVTSLYISRGKHWCMEYKSESYDESEFYIAAKITKSSPVQLNDQLFPGDLDRGTPLVIKENNKNTIIGKKT